MAVARFNLAVDRRYKKEGETTADFPGCVAFGKTAEFAGKYLHKGSKVVVEGRIQTGNYTNKEGTKVYTTDVVVENIEFAESRAADSSGNQNVPKQPAPENADGFVDISDDDDGLPFA